MDFILELAEITYLKMYIQHCTSNKMMIKWSFTYGKQ